MSTPDTESLPADVSEADWADQAIDADPPADVTPGSGTQRGLEMVEANEADLAEQDALAYGGNDDER